jgi:hypothetical protein
MINGKINNQVEDSPPTPRRGFKKNNGELEVETTK